MFRESLHFPQLSSNSLQPLGKVFFQVGHMQIPRQVSIQIQCSKQKAVGKQVVGSRQSLVASSQYVVGGASTWSTTAPMNFQKNRGLFLAISRISCMEAEGAQSFPDISKTLEFSNLQHLQISKDFHKSHVVLIGKFPENHELLGFPEISRIFQFPDTSRIFKFQEISRQVT